MLLPAFAHSSGSTLQAKLIYRLMNILDSACDARTPWAFRALTLPSLSVRTKPATLMHFRAIGSGTGRKEIGVASGLVPTNSVQNHFAASDAPISSPDNAPISPATGVQYLHFPTVVAAVGVFVNIPVGMSLVRAQAG